MSKIADLIKTLCPNGVIYKEISSVFDDFSGMTGVSSKWKESGNCQFIDYMNVYKNNIVDITILPYATVKNQNQRTLKKGDLLLTCASETPEECAVSAVIEDDIQDGIFMDDHLFGLRLKNEYKNIVNPSFINYYLNSNPFRKDLSKAVRGVTRFYVSSDNYLKLRIPIPPISIQNEIVKIFDKFGELEAELETKLESELEARKNQYEFWRDTIFEKESNNKLVDFSEFASVQRGGNFQKKDYVEKGKPCIHYGQIHMRYGLYTDKTISYISDDVYLKQKIAHQNDLIMAVTSENMKDVCKTTAWLGKTDVAVSGHSAIISHNQNPKFLSYYFQSKHFQLQKIKYARGVKVIEFPPDQLNKIKIPLPSIEKQNEIVKKLDKIYKLINSFVDSIPAEIELRRKQYEYYKNKLLSFEELSVSE